MVTKFLRNVAFFFFLQGGEVDVEGKQGPWRKDLGMGCTPGHTISSGVTPPILGAHAELTA